MKFVSGSEIIPPNSSEKAISNKSPSATKGKPSPLFIPLTISASSTVKEPTVFSPLSVVAVNVMLILASIQSDST